MAQRAKGYEMRITFFSFHYQRDIFRVNQIRSIPNVMSCAAAGFQDASLWEDAKRKSDAAIKRLIDTALEGTSVTVVCIGNKTAGRRYITYEIEESLARGNGLVGMQIHHLTDHRGNVDPPGQTPAKIKSAGFKVYKYVNVSHLARAIEEAARLAGR